MRATLRIAAALSAIALLAACGSQTKAPSASSSSSSPASSSSTASTAAKFLGCMVTDTGGIDDRSFNASSWQGMQEAAQGRPERAGQVPAVDVSGSDYIPNINAFVAKKCGIIVTVGFLMGDNTQTAAKANPSQKFAIVDYTYSPAIKNIDALVFNTGAGRLPRRLPGGRDVQDAHRWPPSAARSCRP